MSSRPFYIDSSTNAQVKAGQYTSDDFTTYFAPPMDLGGRKDSQKNKNDVSKDWEIALIAFNGWNTIPNISASLYGNNVFTYKHGVGTYNVTFADGNYSFSQMQGYISTSLVSNGFLSTDIQLIPDTALDKLYIQVAAGFSVDLTTSNWYILGGFTLAQSPIVSPGAYGTNKADIQNGQEAYLIHCDMINSSIYGGNASDVIYTYRPTSSPGAAVTIVVQNPIYFKTSKNDFYDRVRVYITDQLNRKITFLGESVNMTLHARPIVPPIGPGDLAQAFETALREIQKEKK
jgi:hypothetical protein